MYLLAKASPLVLLIGGGSCIPYLLKNSNSPDSPAATSPSATSHTTSSEQDRSLSPHSGERASLSDTATFHSDPQAENSGNCVVEEEEKIAKFLDDSSQYVFFSCSGSGREADDIELFGKWQIWIPEELLSAEESLFAKGQRIDIKVHTSLLREDSYEFNAKFESKVLKGAEITGHWGDNIVLGDSGFLDPRVFEVKPLEAEIENKLMYLQY